MKQRVITGLIMGVVVSAFFALRAFTNLAGVYLFDAFLGIMIVLSSGEVSKVFNRSNKFNNMTIATLYPIFVYLGLLVSINFVFSLGYYFLIQLCLFLLFVLFTFIFTIFTKKINTEQMTTTEFKDTYNKFCLKKSGMTTFILFYPTVLLNFLFVLNHINNFSISTLPLNSQAINLGFMVMLLLFLTNIMTDIFAYFVGITFKGPKIWPLISPNKTYSGCIGGVVGSVVISLILFYIYTAFPMINTVFFDSQITVLTFLLYGFFVSVISQLGGLFASWLKRKAKTKDYSTLFPGHGGFMDRLDGFTFSAFFTFVYVIVMFL